MLTREQATAAYHKERLDTDYYQSRIVQVEQVNWVEEAERDNPRAWMEETVDWEEQAWSIGYQFRWKTGDEWSEWSSSGCYVVEPKPGPYVVK